MILKHYFFRLRFLITKFALSCLFIIVTVLQVFSFPGQFAHIRRGHGITLFVEISLTLLVGAWLASAQYVIFNLYKIVNLMKLGDFYSQKSFAHICRLVTALKFAVLVPMVLFLLLIPQADDPGFFVMLLAVGLFIFTLSAITILLRNEIESKIT